MFVAVNPWSREYPSRASDATLNVTRIPYKGGLGRFRFRNYEFVVFLVTLEKLKSSSHIRLRNVTLHSVRPRSVLRAFSSGIKPHSAARRVTAI